MLDIIVVLWQEQVDNGRKKGRFGPNMMLFDLGVDVEMHMSSTSVLKAVQEVDNVFNLVIISEKMDEGLILMKDLLCWEFNDIIYLLKNARKDHYKTEITPEMRETLQDINYGDYLLYNYFLEKHERSVDIYGRDKMERQVKQLRQLRDTVMEECHVNEGESFNVENVDHPFFNQVNAYSLTLNTSEDCKLLMASEFDFLKMVKTRHKDILKDSTLH